MSETGHRGERGVAVSSSLALLSAGAVLLAAAAFVATGPRDEDPVRASAAATRAATPSAAASTSAPRKKRAKKPVVRRGETYVEVFNNSGISGLAAATATRASGAGWQVVGSDNWYGTIDASTVYYPNALHPQAELLAKDLGITHVKPVFAPMRGDRLTVILTADYS